MKPKKVTTAAFLAGVTTLAVSLPAMGAQRSFDSTDFEPATLSDVISADISLSDVLSVTTDPADKPISD